MAVSPDVRVNQRADVNAITDGLLRHADQPGGAVEHNRVVHVFTFGRKHIKLTIHELPVAPH